MTEALYGDEGEEKDLSPKPKTKRKSTPKKKPIVDGYMLKNREINNVNETIEILNINI